MKRAKPYKIILVLAVIIAGGICLLLPDKNTLPMASVSNIANGSHSSSDTTFVVSTDSSVSK